MGVDPTRVLIRYLEAADSKRIPVVNDDGKTTRVLPETLKEEPGNYKKVPEEDQDRPRERPGHPAPVKKPRKPRKPRRPRRPHRHKDPLPRAKPLPKPPKIPKPVKPLKPLKPVPFIPVPEPPKQPYRPLPPGKTRKEAMVQIVLQRYKDQTGQEPT